MNESALIGAYMPPREATNLDVRSFHLGTLTYRPCLCGTWIGLREDTDWSPGMRAHQTTAAHRAWRERSGL